MKEFRLSIGKSWGDGQCGVVFYGEAESAEDFLFDLKQAYPIGYPSSGYQYIMPGFNMAVYFNWDAITEDDVEEIDAD